MVKSSSPIFRIEKRKPQVSSWGFSISDFLHVTDFLPNTFCISVRFLAYNQYHEQIKTLLDRRGYLCPNSRNSFTLCIWVVRTKLHTRVFLSNRWIHLGAHEIDFFPHAFLFTLYEQATERRSSMRNIIPALWDIVWNLSDPGHFLSL